MRRRATDVMNGVLMIIMGLCLAAAALLIGLAIVDALDLRGDDGIHWPPPTTPTTPTTCWPTTSVLLRHPDLGGDGDSAVSILCYA